MIEIWKDIKGYEGKYQISNLGNVRSLYDENQICKTPRTKMLRLCERNGYCTIVLSMKGKRKSFQVHRLVAETFIPNTKNKPFINHIDENRKNNNVNNLEWCTQLENVKHSLHKKIGSMVNYVGKSGEKYIRIKNNKYEVSIYYKGKRYYVGTYKTLDEAINRRNYFMKVRGVEI